MKKMRLNQYSLYDYSLATAPLFKDNMLDLSCISLSKPNTKFDGLRDMIKCSRCPAFEAVAKVVGIKYMVE